MGQRAFGMHRIGVAVSAQRSLRYSLLAISILHHRIVQSTTTTAPKVEEVNSSPAFSCPPNPELYGRQLYCKLPAGWM